jgi:flagellar M-ring protein FliF
MEIGRYLLYLLIALFVWFKLLKPVLRQMAQPPKLAAAPAADVNVNQAERDAELSRYEENLNVARSLAQQDPRAVAMVMRSWIDKNGN